MISGNLFTLDYLLEGIAQTDYWKSLDDGRVENIKKGLLKHAQKLLAVSKPNEAQTEKTLIYPALELVGWTDVEVQQNLSRAPSMGKKADLPNMRPVTSHALDIC